MTNQELAYTEIEKLIKNFKNIPAAQRKGMNEMQTRLGYILPMFKALGWDTSNINEVSPEEKVSRGWVDFSFRVGNVPRFFLETKKVNEDLNDPRWVKQAIDYAWTKSVTWALLSDFEGLRVFNAEWKESDPFRAQFFEFGIDDYLKDFERLWWLSKEETVARRLDIEAEKVGRKIKRLPVSQNLFDDLKRWRENLFKNYKAFNLGYSAAQIDEAVLRLLNRLIFVRTAEDREVEENRLQSLVRVLKDKKQLQTLDRELASLFRELDGVYNSELFARHFSEELQIPPTELEEIISGLYEKNFTRYNFNALEADVLGTAYEQYLGHIVAEDENETHVEEKRTKRKSQGIYYTPTFVTKYIVQQTVGKYLHENGYNPSKPPRVLDMACGSGSFLIEAFDVIDDFVAKQRGQAQKGEVDFYDRARQLEVLQNCIFGVDKDRQAVEVARLNLLLRGLHSREKLPMLENIANGDSLKSETYPFHFPKIMQDGGFDIIVGNPPYIRIQTLEKSAVDDFNKAFESATGNYDIYVLFVEQALKLLKPNGILGFILPNKFMQGDYGVGLRKVLSEGQLVNKIVDFKEFQVFEGATTYTCVLILQKQANNKFTYIPAYEKLSEFDKPPQEMPNDLSEYEMDSHQLTEKPWNFSVGESVNLITRLKNEIPKLGDVADIFVGLQTSADDVFIMDFVGKTKDGFRLKSELLNSVFEFENNWVFPIVSGTDVSRYSPLPERQYVLFPYATTPSSYKLVDIKLLKKDYPLTYSYLLKNKKRLEDRENGKMNNEKWYGYVYHKNMTRQSSRKLCVPRLVDKLHAAYDFDGKHFLDNVDVGGIVFKEEFEHLDLAYLLALINSKIARWYFPFVSVPFRGGWLSANKQYLSQIPIVVLDLQKPSEKSAHDEIVKLVEKMLAIQKERQSVRPEDNLDRARNLDRQIKEVDSKIDEIVFNLYGLTEQEKKIIEESFSKV